MFQRTVRTPAACGNFSLGLVGRPTHADSELTTGRLICDEIAGPNDMDTAIEQAIDRLSLVLAPDFGAFMLATICHAYLRAGLSAKFDPLV
jgi:hypothetical protein